MAKASLAYIMSVDGLVNDDVDTTEASETTAIRSFGQGQAAAQQSNDSDDPLLSLHLEEIQRLFSVFRDEVQTVFPILDSERLVSRLPLLYERVRVESQSLGQIDTEDTDIQQKETQLLKSITAVALVLESGPAHTKAHDLVKSVESEISSISSHRNVDLATIRTMAVLAIYHVFCDQELYAWRTIGVAGRLALEMGLHRRESLMQSFPGPEERAAAVGVFWCVYVFDHQCSLENGLSFSLHDRDIDPRIPEVVRPPSPRLQAPLTSFQSS